MFPTRFFVVPCAWLAMLAVPAFGLTVQNPSFEGPAITYDPTPGAFNALPWADGWLLTNAAGSSNNVGVFYNSPAGNPDHITNPDLNQLAFLGSETGNGLSQTLGLVYQTGHTYQFTVAVCGSYYRPLAANSTLELVLGYLDNTSTFVDIPSATHIISSASVGDTALTDFSVTLPAVQSTAPWAGRTIDLALRAVGPAGGYWDLDKVRVVETPEPATLALLSPLALLLVRRRASR